ncbi:MAG: hypothetical protein KF760_07890 [Candidatus Eremiobacteraeota bacterium]|nr:hypothetical protein [Candidatus Eremiobacteraeota bacterium]MCW5869582.1 hypothetical protein [Candidatus Eremiobacteraeota bacterium]
MESLLREVPEEILHRPHQPLSTAEAQEQLDNVEALIDQVLATDNQQGESAEQFDLDPRPGHILLRNQSSDHVEEAEAQFQNGVLECKFRRFSPQGGLIRVETVKAQAGPDQVELLRAIWKVDGPERINFYHLNRHRLDQSYRQSNED